MTEAEEFNLSVAIRNLRTEMSHPDCSRGSLLLVAGEVLDAARGAGLSVDW